MLTQIQATVRHDGVRWIESVYALDEFGSLWRLRDDEWSVVAQPSLNEQRQARLNRRDDEIFVAPQTP